MNLKELFQKKQPENVKRIGGMFPEPYRYGEDSSKDKVYCCISLSCVYCVDLLPRLNDFAASYTGEFYLFCNCTNEEIQDLLQYFRFPFKIVPLTDEDMHERLEVRETPYAFHLSNRFEVLNESVVYNDDDLRRLVGQ